MKIVATMPVRNEDWILGLSARAALLWCDELVILDHASTDETPQIILDLIAEYGDRVQALHEPGATWEEMRHRQRLLDFARSRNATHIAIVDADEVLTANLVPVVREMFRSTPSRSILQFPWLCLRGSIDRYHSTGVWSEQHVSTGFVDAADLFWSAEGRGGYDFHHRHPMGRQLHPYIPTRTGGLMHLQFVSDRRLRAKQALYKLTEVLRWPGREPVELVNARYNLAVYGDTAPGGDGHRLAPAPESWWAGYEALLGYLGIDAEPWQEREVRRLVGEYRAERFAGLDLFGVA